MSAFTRRQFVQTSLAGAAAATLPGVLFAQDTPKAAEPKPDEPKAAEPKPAESKPAELKPGELLFKISLAQWSFHNTINRKQMTNLDFPATAKEYGFDTIEYVNQFWMDKAKDQDYLKDLKKRCDDNGIKSYIIMVDQEGDLGNRDEARRKTSVEGHFKWADAAKFLGCSCIRVNARSTGSYDEQLKLCADGISKVLEYCVKLDLDCIVENHGGYSSTGKWMVDLIKKIDHPRCGTLCDFNNWEMGYDRFQGIKDMIPYARSVSGKGFRFDDKGEETTYDFRRAIKTVVDSGYRGYIEVEYEGTGPEPEGVRATKKLMEKVRDELTEAMKAGAMKPAG